MKYWRTLDEQAGIAPQPWDPENDPPPDEASRRRFLQIMGASFGLAGAAACTRQPPEFIVPYVDPPERAIPGRPIYYASAIPVRGVGQGVLVETHLGRPTKLEGNPDHPGSLGATDVITQASVLDLYDPDRAREISYLGEPRSWEAFLSSLQSTLEPIRARQGQGFAILTEKVTSPTLASQLNAVLRELPRAKWHQYEPAGMHSAHSGAHMAFGRAVNAIYQFDQADIVVALDSDFLACSTRYAHDFMARRRRGNRLDMNRLYAIESTMTSTGGKADHRLPMRYGDIEAFAIELAGLVGIPGITASRENKFASAVAGDLNSHRGASAIIAGDHQTPLVHALAHAMNAKLGNVGRTVAYTEPIEFQPVDQVASLRELCNDLYNGSVELLLMLGGNPVYNAPSDFDFRSRLAKAKTSIHVSSHPDETSMHCQWQVPESHPLEDWGDIRGYDGTVSIIQPTINPLYDSHSYIQLLDSILQFPGRTSYEIVRSYWQAQHQGNDFDDWWERSLRTGIVANTALPRITPPLSGNLSKAQKLPAVSGMEIVFREDPYLYDGRYANNAWLQELPRPMSKLTWDNAVQLSPATARKLNINNQDNVALRVNGRSVAGSVWITTGHPDNSVTIYLGHGRTHAGRTGNGAGFNAYVLRTSDALWTAANLEIEKTGVTYPLATTQMQQDMEGRDLVIAETVSHYRENPDFVREIQPTAPQDFSLYPQWAYKGYAWGMSIDLTACVNCNACIVACQAENNIPVVGKGQVLYRRAMHWLRVDVYYQGDPANPSAYYQPVPCMQCEKAPCELVCPVQATNHSSDALNDMVYNRCIGTRYCSNNCPYKVRRFNFLRFQDWTTETLKLQRNPDVSVRERGVMEKCTYCVQRIREAEIRASDEDRGIRDGELQTACQQVCPTQAIVFGDANGASNRVAQLKSEKLNYRLLEELNTRPRTSYLAELRNPNPALNGVSRGDD